MRQQNGCCSAKILTTTSRSKFVTPPVSHLKPFTFIPALIVRPSHVCHNVKSAVVNGWNTGGNTVRGNSPNVSFRPLEAKHNIHQESMRPEAGGAAVRGLTGDPVFDMLSYGDTNLLPSFIFSRPYSSLSSSHKVNIERKQSIEILWKQHICITLTLYLLNCPAVVVILFYRGIVILKT